MNYMSGETKLMNYLSGESRGVDELPVPGDYVNKLPVRGNYNGVDELVVDEVSDYLEDVLLLGLGELGRQARVKDLVNNIAE